MIKVRIHPNRHLVNQGVEECISVTRRLPGGKQKTEYQGTVILKDVKFVIHNSGVKRAQAEGVRNVHAWAEGELQNSSLRQMRIISGWKKVTYYFQEGYFRDFETGRRIEKCDWLYAVGRDFYYLESK